MESEKKEINPQDGVGAMAELTAIFYKTLLNHGIGKKYATDMTCTMIATMFGHNEQNEFD